MRIAVYLFPMVIIALVIFYLWRKSSGRELVRFKTITGYGEKPVGDTDIFIYLIQPGDSDGKFNVFEKKIRADIEGNASILLRLDEISRITYVKALAGETLKGELEKDEIKTNKVNLILMSDFHLR